MSMSLVELEASMTCKPWMRWSAVLLGGVLLYLVLWPFLGDDALRAVKGPPIKHHGVSVSPAHPASPGDVVVLRFDNERCYSCPAQIVRWWLDEKGNRLLDLPSLNGGYSKVGRSPISVRMRVPAEAAGQSRIGYRVMLLHGGPECTPGFVTEPPVVWITISRKVAQAPPRRVSKPTRARGE